MASCRRKIGKTKCYGDGQNLIKSRGEHFLLQIPLIHVCFFSSSFISEYAAEILTILWLFPTEACQGNVVTKPFLGGGHYRRCLSSHVNVQKHGSIAILELNRRPVNSFSLEFLEEINTTLGSLENDQDCQGVIITSVGYHVVHVFYFKWSSD